MVPLVQIVRFLCNFVLLLVLWNYAGWAIHMFVVAQLNSTKCFGRWFIKKVFIHPHSQNNYLGVIVNLPINTRPLKTAQLLCICFLCSWLTGHICVLTHTSGTNRKRQGCRFYIVRSRQSKKQTALSHKYSNYDCVNLLYILPKLTNYS